MRRQACQPIGNFRGGPTQTREGRFRRLLVRGVDLGINRLQGLRFSQTAQQGQAQDDLGSVRVVEQIQHRSGRSWSAGNLLDTRAMVFSTSSRCARPCPE